ncbi:MAG TPA: MFS transporter [Streptosporangiaceae bacterium]
MTQRWPCHHDIPGGASTSSTGAIVYFSAYFQQVQGRSPVAAGLAVCAIGVAYAIAAAWSGRLVGRFGERWPLLIGLAVGGLATLTLRRLSPATGIGAIWWNFALLGAGIGLCGTPMTTLALSAVDVSRAGMASAVLNAARQIGQVFGVAVLGALVYAHLPGGAGRPLDAAHRQLFVAGLHNALLLSGAVLIATALVISPPLIRSRAARPPQRLKEPAHGLTTDHGQSPRPGGGPGLLTYRTDHVHLPAARHRAYRPHLYRPAGSWPA